MYEVNNQSYLFDLSSCSICVSMVYRYKIKLILLFVELMWNVEYTIYIYLNQTAI